MLGSAGRRFRFVAGTDGLMPPDGAADWPRPARSHRYSHTRKKIYGLPLWPRPAIILSADSLCTGVSGHSGGDRSTIVWRTGAPTDIFRS
jgi:hypothetical protein